MYCTKAKILIDAAVHAEHVQVIRCDVGPKPVERSELNVVI
jgi:hypothetical protein